MDKASQDCSCSEGKVPDGKGNCVLPEVTFTTFVMSLNTSILFHLGELADPMTGERRVDKQLARHAIDTLVMLEAKTRGNLDEEEAMMIKEILRDVKLRFCR